MTVSSWVERILGFLATLWVAYTLFALLRYGGAVVLDPSTTSRIMGVRNGDELFSAVGLTYHGVGGALLVLFEVALVAASALAARFSTGGRRIAGLLVLVGWSGLWLGNALWLRSLGWQHGADTVALAVAVAVTLGWTVSVVLGSRSPAR